MIGIVGNGFVGNAVYQNVRDKSPCKVYDVDKNRSLNDLDEVIKQDFVFVCLPTPMRMDGSCDLSILDNFFEELPDFIEGTFIIKSTVPIGTTRKYAETHNVIHNPEFLTARNAVADFGNSERNIIGGDDELCTEFRDIFEKWFPHIPSIIVTSDESEAIKYFSNTFLAYKVAYFNKIYDLCEKTGMNYNNVMKGVTADSRIGKSHTRVPGIDGDRGFGGTCFPKDINSLIVQLEKEEVNADMFREIWKYNQEIRKVIDWTVT
jgi:UDPglucose 6-dehydrogenase